ncbi:hypothetical protein ACET3Z_029595 [Daucus carota]
MEKENGEAFGSVSEEMKTGAGLPYAPQDWPNPGDVWTWKLGRRISADGFYRDRIIFLPKRLHQKGKRKYFDSKKSIITYLQSEFPDTDVDAFFQSFTWRVPASFSTSEEKARASACPKKVHPRSKSEKIGETDFARRSWRLIMSKASSKKKIRFSPKEVNDVIDLSLLSNGTRSCDSTADNSMSGTNSKIRTSPIQNSGSQNSKDGANCHSSKETPSNSIPHDSDMSISSADNPLSQTRPKLTEAGPVNDQSATSQEKMFEARKKLLLLLAEDNPAVLRSSIKLPEIMHTAPNIDANRHGKLKLIDEVPLAWNELQKNTNISEAAGKYSEDLETNIAWATTLVNEYNQSKGYEYVLYKELDFISQNMEKIDEQISTLQSRRHELASAADAKKKVVDMLISKQERAAESLSNAVHVAEMGKERRQIWELEKEMPRDEENILSEFVPLRDFFL